MKWTTGIAVLFFLGLVYVIANPDIIDQVYEVAKVDEERILVPDESVAGIDVSATPAGAIPTPRSVPKSELTIQDLKILALSYINEDRALHGLDPVTLNDNSAAQSHADDMLEGRYLGHWWMDGRKPYMVYSQTGGDSYVSENAARSGFSESEYAERCSSRFVRCAEVDPQEDVKRLHYLMVYDDASSDWGHRDNILNPDHRKVSIGVAYSKYFLAFVQHFEGGTVTVIDPPRVDSSGTLSLSAQINEPDFNLFSSISIHREDLPVSRAVDEIEELHSYCVGGDFSESCGDPVARILRPPPRGRHYVGLPDTAFVADTWEVTSQTIQIEADLGALVSEPGIYTVSLYRDEGGQASGGLALQLSFTVLDSKIVLASN